MTTGEKIAEGRKKLGLTQQQFADRLGVTRQAVSRWESDLAFPETDTLIKMSEEFGCSIDYIIKYNDKTAESGKEDGANDSSERSEGEQSAQFEQSGQNKQSEQTSPPVFFNNFIKFSHGGLPYIEWKSKTKLFGLPLVHVNIGLGRVAKGVFSVGLVSVGLVSVGLVSVGLLALGTIALGLLSLGALSFGVIAALGGVAISALIAFGGVAVGSFAFGGCAVGLFTFGGYSNGAYIAVGDYAYGGITFGETYSGGRICAVLKETYEMQKDEAFAHMQEIPSFWQPLVSLCKHLAIASMTGS